jgi:tetratricopeptide (TPR) repeat protein
MIRKKAAADDAPPDVLLPALGWISFHVDHDLTSALRAFARAAHLPPDSWRCRNRNTLAVSRHRFDEALDGLQQGIAADPYSSWLRARRAWVLHLAGQAGASVDQVRENLEMFSGENGILAYAAIILAYNGETAEAVELARGLADRSPHYDVASAVLAYALACAGRPSEAIALLDRLQWLGRERYALRSFNAAAYLALGEPERAMEELRASLESRCPWFFQTLADPRLAPLRTRPDFREMLATLSRMESEAAGAGLQ